MVLMPNYNADANFPDGYSPQLWTCWAFDWTRQVGYIAIDGSGHGGIATYDLGTMVVTRTTTLEQMYEDTPYGKPPGFPPSDAPTGIYDICCGQGTDIFILTAGEAGLPNEWTRFTRVDPVTMKVTGESYTGSGGAASSQGAVMGGAGVTNRTSGHTFVGYLSNGGTDTGPQFYDGTAMSPIGIGPTPTYTAYQCNLMPGLQAHGACQFIFINSDWIGTSGNIDIWSIMVSDAGDIDSELLCTVPSYFVFPEAIGGGVTVPNASYDARHGSVILWLSTFDNLDPTMIVSVNLNGTVNWTLRDAHVSAGSYNKSQDRLTSNTMMQGGGRDFIIIDTDNGTIVWTGPPVNHPEVIEFGVFYHIYDAQRMSYYAFALSVGPAVVRWHPISIGKPSEYLRFITCCDRAIMAHLYEFTSAIGDNDYFTDFDVPIVYHGNLYKADALRFEGLQRKLGVGLSVDEQSMKIWAGPYDTIFGAEFLAAVEEGILDGAVIVRKRILWEFVSGNVERDIQNDPLIVWTLFTGYTSSVVKGGRSHVELKVKSALLKLNVNMPRNYYQPGCLWTLFDHGCSLNKSAYAKHATIDYADSNNIVPRGGVDTPYSADSIATYAQGRLIFTSGVNQGLQVLMDDNDPIALHLAYKLNDVPNVGDTITYYPGCSKSYNTCQLKFNNQANFRGFDKVPPIVISV
jgi:uncharacterized phage protein (TIGR02218 family)